MIGKCVKITEGKFKNKTGKIVDEYDGWMFSQYTILLDEDDQTECVVYHNEIEEMK